MFFISFSKRVFKSKKIRYGALCFSAVLAVLGATAVFGLLTDVPDTAYCEALGEYSLLAKSEKEREKFFSQFGLSAESVSASSVRIPQGGEIFRKYNELQETMGFELVPYSGKTAQQYVLSLSAQSQNGAPLYGVLTVYKDRVVAVHLTDFLYPSTALSLCDGLNR